MRHPFKKILVLTDNLYLFEQFKKIANEGDFRDVSFTYRFSFRNKDFLTRFNKSKDFKPINVAEEAVNIASEFDLVISLHSKQIFPESLIELVKCINIHPGLNPYNRGWYPQVFSILNGLPLGATIHEIDAEIDHGPIICQKKVEVLPWDTSLTVYNRVVSAELDLLRSHLSKIIANKYKVKWPEIEGNLNSKRDFQNLCEINPDHVGKFGDFYNLLRAMTHGNYKNAYILDKESGKKIFISLNIDAEPEEGRSEYIKRDSDGKRD